MAKRKRKFTATTFTEWVQQGRGSGEGPEYKPWYKIQDVASYGLCHRIYSTTTNRVMHLLSNLERDWFFIFDWSRKILDIREQFPLLPLKETLSLANECNVKHPRETKTKERHAVVLTTDLLLTVSGNPFNFNQALTIKYSGSLNQRVLEKFEIERRYWKRRDVKWSILTEKNLPYNFARNVELLRNRADISDRLQLAPERIIEIANSLTTHITNNNMALREAASTCDAQFELPRGGGLTIAYYLLANRYWVVDMNKRIHPCHRLGIIKHCLDKMEANIMQEAKK